MKYLKVLFILCLVFGCQEANKKHVAVGTWNKCNIEGSYVEYKITDNYFMFLKTKSDEIFIFRNKIVDDKLILSEFKNGTKIITNNDTLITVRKSKNKVVLKSTYNLDFVELNNAEFDFDRIDSAHLELWKNKALSEFKKRAESIKCRDLRTEEEKTIQTLYLDEFLEEEIEIDLIEE